MLRYSVLSALFCFGTAVSTPVLAADVFPTTNPNAGEWALIKLTPSLVSQAKGGAGVTVAVLDGFADCRHADLAGRCSVLSFTGGTYTTYSSHGSHTAGTVAGSRYGVATGASVVDYAVFDDKAYVATGTRLMDAWTNAAARKASVASMSFGCTGRALCFTAAEVKAMAGSSLSGMLFVKAAGNDALALASERLAITDAESRTALSRLILVGSVSEKGTISSFSNRAGDGCLLATGITGCSATNQWKYHFIVAPGEAIYATQPNGSYAMMSGTSMATPIVAGTVALLEARWPALKAQPASVASLLFKTATDLGAPGVDAVYGQGLLNVTKAFQNYGTTTVTSPAGTTVVVSNATLSGGSTFGQTAAAIGGVTAFDAFGRDYRLDEVSDFRVRRTARISGLLPAGRLSDLGSRAAWTSDFFAEAPAARAWARFGGDALALTESGLPDLSLRAGLSLPAGTGSVQLRLTGAANVRADLANDPALRPLSFFASSDLLGSSGLAGLTLPVSDRGRLMVYSAASAGGHLSPAWDDRAPGLTPRRAVDTVSLLQTDRTTRRQSMIGVGYWAQPDARTVVGVTASAFRQKHGLYDLSSTLALFDRNSGLYNLGVAGSRSYGTWDLYGSAELTRLKTPVQDGPLAFTDATLASAEIGARKNGLLFRHGPRRDALSVSLAAKPHALSGRLSLSYLGASADGLSVETVRREIPLAKLTGRVLRLEGGYSVHEGRRWSAGLAGGVDLTRAPEAQLVARMSRSF
ncbi:S8 family serine peptidase [Caulobacter sp. HMWF009]|uniref:S8 family peptidase n=1 Tax=Caulobacter sp. HMWF009 TaxID=2056846 RepID=UPI000D3A3A32|nr:S8 family serine peptidase [Caulobacter sp. HMWF009]PTS90297.1 hypothetical protein DBR21_04410 [Caulobacter sp. HMWF009]